MNALVLLFIAIIIKQLKIFSVGSPGFDSLAESNQNTLKVGIYSFPA